MKIILKGYVAMSKNRVLAVVGTSLAIGIGIFLSMKRDLEKYSGEWFKAISRVELGTEREKIQKLWCSTGGDYLLGIRLQNLLYRFDDEIRLRDYGDLKPEDYEYPANMVGTYTNLIK